MTAQSSAPGWDAIDAACRALYPDEEPLHFGMPVHERGRPGLLDGISVWKRLLPLPHWHFVTYGLSELFDKETEDKEVSGFGFELTFRVKCEADAAGPPNWALNFLLNLSRYVYRSENRFGNGHRMTANGPIAADSDTLIHAMAFVHDPELPLIGTPNGRVQFLQIVGLTMDEHAAAQRWSTDELLGVLLPSMPLWITDLERSSLLDRNEIRNIVEAGMRRDGSTASGMLVEKLIWHAQESGVTVTLGARQISELVALLPLRLLLRRPYEVKGESQTLNLASSRRNAYRAEDDTLYLDLTDETVREIVATLRPQLGIYGVPSFTKLRFVVRTTRIRKRTGEVVETIG